MPSEKSAEQTPPDDTNMATALVRMTDYELVQVGLVALAILHQRAEEIISTKVEEQADAGLNDE